MSAVPLGFRDEAEWLAWQDEMHLAQGKLRDLGERAEKLRELALADAAAKAGGVFGGVPLPEEVRDALTLAKRAAGFIPLLPDSEIPAWTQRLAEIVALVARALGV